MYHKRRKATPKRKTHHRRRRVSGMGSVDIMSIIYLIAGAVIGRVVSTKLAASTNTTFQKLAAYASVALGVAGLTLMKNPTIKVLSMGLVAGGGVTLLGPTGLKVISGMEATISGHMGYPYNAGIPYRKVAGIEYQDKANWSGGGNSAASVISGINPAMMAGGAGCGSGSYGSMMGF